MHLNSFLGMLSVFKLVKNPEKINIAMDVTGLSEFLAVRV